MNIQLNGQMITTQTDKLSDLLYEQKIDAPCIAVVFNGIFVPQNQYNTQLLEEGCQLEVLSPMQGG